MSTEAPEMPTTGDEISDEPLPETIAGRYKIRRLLGRGGFGAVYEAYDQLEARLVALKVIRHDISAEPGTRSVAARSLLQPPSSSISRYSDPLRKTALISRSFGNSQGLIDDATVRFKDEFRLLTQLHHPNLAAVYDFGRCDAQDSFFFTQELIHGLSLGEYLKGAPQAVVVEVFVQLARALDYIHTLGFVHEDIKPSNVLVLPPESEGAPPQAKIIDFGLARVLRRPTAAAAEEYEVHGTPGFSAPEKIRGESTDGRSDIYALAATLYTALRGAEALPLARLQGGAAAPDGLAARVRGRAAPLHGPVIAELIGRMLEPGPQPPPAERPQHRARAAAPRVAHIRDRQKTAQDRREFARVLVEHLPFVDRADYLDILLHPRRRGAPPGEQARDLRPTRGRLVRTVVVEAPEGMGKGRLLAELRREVQLGDGVFVEGNCWTADGDGVGSLRPARAPARHGPQRPQRRPSSVHRARPRRPRAPL
jgi:serine/threonine protein kinase